jgi:hypothetical protein
VLALPFKVAGVDAVAQDRVHGAGRHRLAGAAIDVEHFFVGGGLPRQRHRRSQVGPRENIPSEINYIFRNQFGHVASAGALQMSADSWPAATKILCRGCLRGTNRPKRVDRVSLPRIS